MSLPNNILDIFKSRNGKYWLVAPSIMSLILSYMSEKEIGDIMMAGCHFK